MGREYQHIFINFVFIPLEFIDVLSKLTFLIISCRSRGIRYKIREQWMCLVSDIDFRF